MTEEQKKYMQPTWKTMMDNMVTLLIVFFVIGLILGLICLIWYPSFIVVSGCAVCFTLLGGVVVLCHTYSRIKLLIKEQKATGVKYRDRKDYVLSPEERHWFASANGYIFYRYYIDFTKKYEFVHVEGYVSGYKMEGYEFNFTDISGNKQNISLTIEP